MTKNNEYWIIGAIGGILGVISLFLIEAITPQDDWYNLLLEAVCTIVGLIIFSHFYLTWRIIKISQDLQHLLEGGKCDENPTLIVESTKN